MIKRLYYLGAVINLVVVIRCETGTLSFVTFFSDCGNEILILNSHDFWMIKYSITPALEEVHLVN